MDLRTFVVWELDWVVDAEIAHSDVAGQVGLVVCGRLPGVDESREGEDMADVWQLDACHRVEDDGNEVCHLVAGEGLDLDEEVVVDERNEVGRDQDVLLNVSSERGGWHMMGHEAMDHGGLFSLCSQIQDNDFCKS